MTPATAPTLLPDVTPSKSQRAYDWIRERITEQDFTPGYRLVLGVIANELDMSPVPVREAIRQLEAEGMVTYERNVGAQVAMVDVAQYRESMQTLGFLEGAATALAAPLLTADDLREARNLNARMAAQLDDFNPHTFTVLNEQFHTALFSRCPNARLLELVKAEWTRLRYLRDSTFTFVPDRARESVREHEQVVKLIEEVAPPADIESAARRHRGATLDAFMTREQPGEPAGLAIF